MTRTYTIAWALSLSMLASAGLSAHASEAPTCVAGCGETKALEAVCEAGCLAEPQDPAGLHEQVSGDALGAAHNAPVTDARLTPAPAPSPPLTMITRPENEPQPTLTRAKVEHSNLSPLRY